YAPDTADRDRSALSTAAQRAVAMHRAFHAQQEHLIARNMCGCDGCSQAGKLKVKFVAHVGEVGSQAIGRRKQLVGVDVIVVHRMLKNSVPVPEYLLVSEPLYERGDPTITERANAIEEEFEGLGETRVYFVDMGEIADSVPAT